MERLNKDEAIINGNKVWIGSRLTVLKGAIKPDNCVIGANTDVTKKQLKEYSLLAGKPVCVIKENIT